MNHNPPLIPRVSPYAVWYQSYQSLRSRGTGSNLPREYLPAAVAAVSKEVVSGEPDQYISTSYVERQNLSLRMGSRRFTRLTNGFSKKLDNHVAAVALYVAHYNLCRIHEALKTTPAKALGVVDRTSIGELIDAALATQPITPVTTAPERRRKFHGN